jgi:hypothetical protein
LSLKRNLNGTTNKILNVDKRIRNLPTRVSKIRQSNYKSLTHLETNQSSLLERWNESSPDLKQTARNRRGRILHRINDLERELSQRHRKTVYNISNLKGIENRLSNVRQNVSELNNYVSNSLSGVENGLRNIDEDLKIAENTVNLTSKAIFSWKEGEVPILSVKAKDLDNDIEGVLTLTNYRIIFESEKEVILKKRFFIVTEKKEVREVQFEKPIGFVKNLTKGRVGILKGAGIFIDFNPKSGLKQMKFDTKGYEADWLVRFYNFIISGTADEELSTVEPPVEKEPLTLICQVCGAPYNEEVYRGQTSLNCKYCDAVMQLK